MPNAEYLDSVEITSGYHRPEVLESVGTQRSVRLVAGCRIDLVGARDAAKGSI